LIGEASVKMADAKNTTARSKLSPGSILALDEDDAIDIDTAPELAPAGNTYIKSMAKLIAAWIR